MVANPGEIVKFWKRQDVHKKLDIKNNINLNENFIATITNKDSFNTVGKDSVQEVINMVIGNYTQYR